MDKLAYNKLDEIQFIAVSSRHHGEVLSLSLLSGDKHMLISISRYLRVDFVCYESLEPSETVICNTYRNFKLLITSVLINIF